MGIASRPPRRPLGFNDLIIGEITVMIEVEVETVVGQGFPRLIGLGRRHYGVLRFGFSLPLFLPALLRLLIFPRGIEGESKILRAQLGHTPEHMFGVVLARLLLDHFRELRDPGPVPPPDHSRLSASLFEERLGTRGSK